MESEWDVLAEIKATLDPLAYSSFTTHLRPYQRPPGSHTPSDRLTTTGATELYGRQIGRETNPAIRTEGSFNITASSYRRLSTTLGLGNNYP
jgi:hypothetical protein